MNISTLDDASVTAAVAGAADLAFSGPYLGVSYKDLARYNRWESAAQQLTLDERDAEITQLYAALSVLVRASLRRDESAPADRWLRNSATAVTTFERRIFGAGAFPYDDEAFPHKSELAALDRAVPAHASIPQLFAALQLDVVRHEWTVKPGKRLFVELSGRISTVARHHLCSDQAVLGRIENQNDFLDGSKEVVLVMLAHYGFEQALLPTLATLGVILVRRGLREFCARPAEANASR